MSGGRVRGRPGWRASRVRAGTNLAGLEQVRQDEDRLRLLRKTRRGDRESARLLWALYRCVVIDPETGRPVGGYDPRSGTAAG